MNSAEKSRKKLLAKTAGEMPNFHGSHGQNTVAENNQTSCYCV